MNSFLSNHIKFLLVFSFIFLVTVTACSDRDTKVDACSITVDTVQIIDSKIIGNTTYYLVHRISGWQDKIEIIELYDDKPVFDSCSKTSVEPIDGDSLEMTKTVSHVFFNIKERKLDIVYKDGLPMKNQKDLLNLEIK